MYNPQTAVSNPDFQSGASGPRRWGEGLHCSQIHTA